MEIKDRIIEVAGNLFMQYGTRSVTMDDISRKLSISKKTIYQYFTDKDEIVTTNVKEYLQNDENRFQEIFDLNLNAIEEIFEVSNCLRKTATKTNPSFIFDLQKYHPKAWGISINHKNKFVKNAIVSNLKKGINQGYYRPTINPEILATFRIQQVQLPLDISVFPRDIFNFVDVQMQLFDHFVHGLFTDKGRQLYNDYKFKINNK